MSSPNADAPAPIEPIFVSQAATIDRVKALTPCARRTADATTGWPIEERPAGFRQSDHSSMEVAVNDARDSFFAPMLERTFCALIFSVGNSNAIARIIKSMCK